MPHPFTNRLVDALPPRERAEILALMQPVALPLRSVSVSEPLSDLRLESPLLLGSEGGPPPPPPPRPRLEEAVLEVPHLEEAVLEVPRWEGL